jgi:hypothetical protein
VASLSLLIFFHYFFLCFNPCCLILCFSSFLQFLSFVAFSSHASSSGPSVSFQPRPLSFPVSFILFWSSFAAACGLWIRQQHGGELGSSTGSGFAAAGQRRQLAKDGFGRMELHGPGSTDAVVINGGTVKLLDRRGGGTGFVMEVVQGLGSKDDAGWWLLGHEKIGGAAWIEAGLELMAELLRVRSSWLQ